MAERKKEGATEEIQEVEYTPSSEDVPSVGESANPMNEVKPVVYATPETTEEKAVRTAKGLGEGAAKVGIVTAKAGLSFGKAAVDFAMQSAKGYMAKKRAEKQVREAEQPQPQVRKFGRHTIRPTTEVYSPPQSPQMRTLEAQFYQEESGGIQAMMQPKQAAFMDRFGGQSNIMAKFGARKTTKGQRAAISPLQRMMLTPKRPPKGNTSPLQKMMGGGSFFIGKRKKGR